MDFDTITSISTPMGEGAIGIVRLSGPQAIEIGDILYKGKKKLSEVETHTINYGHIIDPETKETVEEVMVSVLRAPKTFTREDIIEINCHGGILTINRILELTMTYGARMAEPGEYTKRAFLNGRIDLSQAEAVMDFIRSKTDRASKVAMNQIEGRLSDLIKKQRQSILEILAQVEVNIDYPEYDDVEDATTDFLLEQSKRIKEEINRLLETGAQGKIMREGLSTVIVGRPNVGKSSMLNNLIQDNKAIVTEVAGTTRDVLEEYVNVRGVPLRLVDTAGIRDTEDIVEKIGVERSRKALSEADLILFVLNNNEPLTEDDQTLFEVIKNEDVIVIINKTDLEQRLDVSELREMIGDMPLIQTSMLKQEGIDELEIQIKDLFFGGEVQNQDMTYVSNSRHISLLKQARQSIQDAIDAAESGIPMDMVQIDLTRTWEILGEIIGESASDELIDQLFSQFCLGK
ncbi:tRNA uridine-5-carboxymethylaminomethyl(34) synthesis GTPase MnmE [Staphylococcus epidermidis]|jgi:tRNA modification GTPase trmE|uniref:tRNA uridine-5-carboxymethylaminomethyl(34) synthesis GTPase MnmE n=1 Tax=Staphylococcus epidermidis TaxID=1282 RepID=UPI0002432FCF|nr:tRNA uridine-5-carboxymethylaminomethyl(34) synthesis GTPase MnmE [Staphylococcus epidermidis]MBA9873891.1 tRNA uridine-5-carboxymethylaminomethyl(34) synthesis GTPase MnmE [Ralstonia insidiosa]EHM69748.1 tRNA modification GTPase TrmE [Staphylococcus epidermidis VCU071]MBC3169103.1 tRNA uridine-5-carboxymethylaminomethyl(34) synthesis GTPase MnmE [Staphylococcus epidermidis]MBE0334713.1 tRNA uridine-5-carboxymethylaminomethyl(34) synthesis GTPase MnmE [Staphylococcus epidermidis]MBM0766755.